MRLEVCLRLKPEFLVVEVALTTDWELNVAIGIKWLLVDVRESDLKRGDDNIFNMISEPAIIKRVDDLHFKGVKRVVHWNVIFLLKVQLIIQDSTGLKDPWVAA